MDVNISVSLGELVDKITILKIKRKFIKDKDKIFNIEKELNNLNSTLKKLEITNEQFNLIENRLLETNTKLWKIEDEIRVLEKEKNFGPKFIELARSVYITNDLRFNLKNNLNNLFNSEYKEEKSYKDYN